MIQLHITTTTTTTTKGGKISINPLSCHLTSYVSSRPSRHLCAGGQTHISLSPSQPAALIPSLSDHPSNPLSPIQVSQASSSLVNPLYCYFCLSHTVMISLVIAHISEEPHFYIRIAKNCYLTSVLSIVNSAQWSQT